MPSPSSRTTSAGHADPEDHVPLKAAHHLALLLLAMEPTYGVELLQRIEARSRGRIRLNAGSLYRMLAQLVEDGLVEPVEEVVNPAGAGAPRKLYGVTELGRAVLGLEASRQADLLALARSLDLAGRKP